MTDTRGDRLLIFVARLNRWATRHAKLPAPAAQLRLLTVMNDLGPSRIGDLAKADNSSQPTMTTQVQRLEALGLVSRKQDERDGRATLITMNDAGMQMVLEARAQRAQAVVPLLEGLSDEELATIDSALDILERRLAQQRGGPRP